MDTSLAPPGASPGRQRRKSGIRPPTVIPPAESQESIAASPTNTNNQASTLLPPTNISSSARRRDNSERPQTRQRSHSSTRSTPPTKTLPSSKSYHEGLTISADSAADHETDGPALKRQMSGIRQPTPVKDLARSTPKRKHSIGTPHDTPPLYPRKNSGIKPPTPVHADLLDPLSSTSPSPNRSPLPPLSRKNSGRKAHPSRRLNFDGEDGGVGPHPKTFTDQNLDPEYVKGLQAEIATLRAELNTTKDSMKAASEAASLNTDKLETDLAEVKARSFDQEQTIERLTKTIEESKSAFEEQKEHEAYLVKKLEIDKEILADSVSSYKTSYAKLEKDNATLKQRVETQEEQLTKVRASQMRRAREWVESKKKVAADHEKELNEMKQQLEEERRLNVEQERNLRNEISELQNLLHGAEDRLKATSNEQQKEYNSALIMYEKTRKSWDLEIEARKKAERRVESLKKELQMIKEQDENYKHRLEGTEDWEEKFWQVNDELASSRSDTLLWKEKFQELLSTMENEDRPSTSHNARVQELEDQLAELESSLSAAERHNDSLEKEVARKSALLEEADKMLESRSVALNDGSSDSEDDLPPSRTASRANSNTSTPSHRLVRSPSMSTMSKRALLAQINEIREKWVDKSVLSGKLPSAGSLSAVDLRQHPSGAKSRTLEEHQFDKPLSTEEIAELLTHKIEAWQHQLSIAVSAGSALYRKMIQYSLKFRSLKQANLQLRLKLDRLREDKTSLLERARSRESNMDATEQDVEQLQETTKQLQRRLSRAESMSEQKTSDLTETFRLQIDALKLRNEQLETEVDKLESVHKELTSELAEKDDDIQKLSQTIDELEASQASEQQNKQPRKVSSDLTVPENDEDPEFSALLLQQLQVLKAQIAELDTSNTESHKELTETRKLLQKAQDEKELLQNQIKDLKMEKNAAETEALTLKADLSAAEARQMELEIAPIITECGENEPPPKNCCSVM